MATGASALAVTYPTDTVIEATTPEVQRKKSIDGNYGIQERVYGFAARSAPGVSFHEYSYWAKIERELEQEDNKRHKAIQGPMTFSKMIKNRFSHGGQAEDEKAEAERRSRALQAHEESSSGNEKDSTAVTAIAPPDVTSTSPVTDAEWRNASRALRTAGWGTIFFLVTTDILGWSQTPYVHYLHAQKRLGWLANV